MRLDDAYANAAYIPNSETFPETWAQAARMTRARLAGEDAARLDLEYGAKLRERFDLFLPEGAPRGLFVFVHGGYWRMFDKSYWSHLCEGMRTRGWAVAMPSYTLAPEARISDITREIARAITVASEMIEGPIALAGHSAGGHLVARMLCADVLPAPVRDRLSHVMPISPVADLRPLLETSMNADFQLDLADAEAESLVLMEQAVPCPVTVWVGADERPAFLEQAAALAAHWGTRHVVDHGKHHFDVIDALEDAQSSMVAALCGD